MTREEILSKQTITNFSGVEFVKPHNALIAMQEYADQETQRIKAELAEKDKLYQILDNKVAILQSELTEQREATNQNAEKCISLSKQLSELKEKHTFLVKEYNKLCEND